MARKRDYGAEYRRRQELAKARGFGSYAKQRRAIEQGKTRAIAPNRLRSRRTIENQTQFHIEVFGGQKAPSEKTRRWAESLDLQSMRIERATDWSYAYSRSEATKFDPEKARKDPRYLDRYEAAFVGPLTEANQTRHFEGTDAQREWFVDEIEYFEAEEFDDRYGDNPA